MTFALIVVGSVLAGLLVLPAFIVWAHQPRGHGSAAWRREGLSAMPSNTYAEPIPRTARAYARDEEVKPRHAMAMAQHHGVRDV